MYRIFLLFCFINCISSCCNSKSPSNKISQDCVKDTIYTTFKEYDETVLTYEKKIINHIKQKAVIIAQDRNNICKSELILIGSILNLENDTMTFLKKEYVFGLQQSPHANGSIVVYKNKIRQGYYSNFYKGFFVEIKNNLLYIKEVMEVDLDGNPVFGVLNSINFRTEIPHSIFIYTDKEWGNEYIFMEQLNNIEQYETDK